MHNDPRYPYTYAADLIRDIPGRLEIPGMPELGLIEVKLSRGEASRIWHVIAEIAGIPVDILASRLADRYLATKE